MSGNAAQAREWEVVGEYWDLFVRCSVQESSSGFECQVRLRRVRSHQPLGMSQVQHVVPEGIERQNQSLALRLDHEAVMSGGMPEHRDRPNAGYQLVTVAV